MRIGISVLFFCLFSIAALLGQNDFMNCTAILLNNKMVVNEYTPSGTCELSLEAKGKLTVQPVTLQEDGSSQPQGKRRFKIAIRDFNTKTLISFSDKTYEEIEASAVLSQCRRGDYIVFLTMDRDLALPHNEVLVK
jgi:hypothetical protein